MDRKIILIERVCTFDETDVSLSKSPPSFNSRENPTLTRPVKNAMKIYKSFEYI